MQRGAEVTWLAPARIPRGPIDDDKARRLYEKAREVALHLERRADIPRERRRWLERTRARIIAFRKADLPRNRSVFRATDVDWRVGLVERLRPRDDGIEAMIRIAGQVELQTQRFEQVVVAIGQDDRAAAASTALVERVPMTWLQHDGRDARPGAPGMSCRPRLLRGTLAASMVLRSR